MVSVPLFKLNNGITIPSVGLGCWMGGTGETENTATVEMVKTALPIGYTHIDTADGYQNEEAVGKAIRAVGGREKLFVTTKLAQTDHGRVKEAFEESLKKLDIGYIDLYLMHWPHANDPVTKAVIPRTESPIFEDTWAEMEKLLAGGKVKAIGVSNFSVKTLEELLKTAKVVPAVNQVECHPSLPQNELLEYCKSKGIVLTAYSPLAQIEDETITSIAKAHNATPAQVVLTWNVLRGVSVIPKSANEGRLKSNITLLPLSEEEQTAISNIHTKPGKYRSLCGYINGGVDVPGSIYGWTFDVIGWDYKAFAHYPGW